MSQITINQALSIQKSIRARISELTALRSEVSTRETYYGSGATTKTVEPQYDVTTVDSKIQELSRILFEIDGGVKKSNSITEIEVPIVNIERIFEPLK